MLPNPYVLLGAAGAWLASIVLCGWLMYARGHDDMRNAYNERDLNTANQTLGKFEAATDRINAAANSYSGIAASLNSKLDDFSKGLRNAIAKTPLPADCKPDPDRMRALFGAIDATNSAIGQRPIPAVPNAH